jgi:signal transduction histidine kinase
MQLMCRGRTTKGAPGQAHEFFASMIDVTERRQLDHTRAQLAREHASLASRLLSAQEDERRHIAADLHDDIGQRLTALRLRIEHVIARAGTTPLRSQLEQLRQSVAELDDALHRVSAGLRPASLDLGIVPAARQLLDTWSTASGVAVSLHADSLPEHWLEPDIETQLFRVLQEALTNIVKHANARHVTVELTRLDAGASLRVEDDGIGFELDAVRTAKRGLGLIGMRERVQLVGGRLELTARAGGGTVVSVTVPTKWPTRATAAASPDLAEPGKSDDRTRRRR